MTSSNMNPDDAFMTRKFRNEIKERGLAECPVCQLAFLTINGVKKHINEGNDLICCYINIMAKYTLISNLFRFHIKS